MTPENAMQDMLAELSAHKLEVMLVPVSRHARCYTGEHSMKRVACNVGPLWYRHLCRAHPSSRGIRRNKFDTRVRRANILRVLGRLAAGLPSVSKYAGELRMVAKGRAA